MHPSNEEKVTVSSEETVEGTVAKFNQEQTNKIKSLVSKTFIPTINKSKKFFTDTTIRKALIYSLLIFEENRWGRMDGRNLEQLLADIKRTGDQFRNR